MKHTYQMCNNDFFVSKKIQDRNCKEDFLICEKYEKEKRK